MPGHLAGVLLASAQVGGSMAAGDSVCQFIEQWHRAPRVPQGAGSGGAAALGSPNHVDGVDAGGSGSDAAATVTRPTLPSLWAGLDLARTARMGTTGIVANGPWVYVQYQMFERLFPGTTTAAVAKKVVSAATLAPISIALTFSTVLALERNSDRIGDKLQADVMSTWAMGAVFWPAVLTINFRYVPLRSRPLVAALASSAWSVFVSYQANKKLATTGGDARTIASTSSSSSSSSGDAAPT